MKIRRYSMLLWLLIIFMSTDILAFPKTTIVLTTPSEDALGAIRLLVNQFNAHQAQIYVKLKMLSTSTDDCHNFYQTSFMSRSGDFDVFSGDIIWTPEFASCGWIEPLDAYFKKDAQAKFLPGAIKSCIYNRKIWAVPWYTDFGVLFYRKDLVGQPPTSWLNLLAVAKRMMQSGKVKYGYVFQGNQYEGLVCNALEFIFNNGGEVLEGNSVLINSPAAVQGLQIMIDVMKICPPEVINFQEEDARLAFQDGQIAFLRNWPYDWNLLNQTGSPLKGKVGVAPLPIGPKGSKGEGCLGGWNLMLNHFSKNKQAAWKFIEFMTGEQGQKINSITGGRLPTRMAVYKDPEVLKRNPYYSGFLNTFARSKPRPVSPFYPAISEAMQNNFYLAIIGKIGAQAAIANIEMEMKQILANQ